MIFEVTGEEAIKPRVWETAVAEVIPRTKDVKSFRFPKPEGFQHKAGQWMYINIKIEGTQKLHHFTISSSPTENYLEFTKKITDSQYSQALDKMKPGDWAKINAPFGEFTYSGEKIKIGALTGGIGITPLHSICRYCVDEKLPTSIVMLYSNKTEDEIVFKDELEEMHKADPNIVVKNVLTRQPDWKGLKGHVNTDMIKEQIPDYRERVFYICGPPSLNEAMKKALEGLNLREDQIKLEDFTGYQ
ncbi:putative oxidoreductase [Methanocella paludicola SANAE]|uniref:Oxidoreductase n=1 Tax=Methanocella paludicola (strain DSM 17711 / JCM 13418 / NBRC 101707 / SANAE) TaxID=304371 RepID=D1YXR1_METPS|nr:FAD-dependent oxidoreductase [Methanocella paludicola]BAI61233.1 putative oxidoreductase [Methanocella paludicola SANAE]